MINSSMDDSGDTNHQFTFEWTVSIPDSPPINPAASLPFNPAVSLPFNPAVSSIVSWNRRRLSCFDALSTISEVTEQDTGSQYEHYDSSDESVTQIRSAPASAGVIAPPTVISRGVKNNVTTVHGDTNKNAAVLSFINTEAAQKPLFAVPELDILKQISSGPPPLSPSELLGINLRREEALRELTDRTKYTIVQRNGQRIYGGPPPEWVGPAPSKGCEVFVGKVPRDCFEDELVPIFERIGRIYELRLMMDFSGLNRGYFFVRYTNLEDAKTAVRKLNNFQIRINKSLGVVQSVDNRKLWIYGVPKNCSADEIKFEMSKLTDGVVDVKIYPARGGKKRDRGYFYVEYETHRCAALARRKLVPGKIFICGLEITKVDWAEPESEIDDAVMAKVKVLFVRNLSLKIDEDGLREFFNKLSSDRVERVKKFDDFAFINFISHEAAEVAFSKAKNNVLINGKNVEVKWAKPIDKSAKIARRQSTKQESHEESLSLPMLAQTFQPTYQTYGPPQLEYPGFQNQAESAIYNQGTPLRTPGGLFPFRPDEYGMTAIISPFDSPFDYTNFRRSYYFPPGNRSKMGYGMELFSRGYGPSMTQMVPNMHTGFEDNAPRQPIEVPAVPTFGLANSFGVAPVFMSNNI